MRPWLCSNDHPREAGGTSVTHIANAHRTTIARPTKLPTFLLYSTVPVAQSAAVSLNLGPDKVHQIEPRFSPVLQGTPEPLTRSSCMSHQRPRIVVHRSLVSLAVATALWDQRKQDYIDAFVPFVATLLETRDISRFEKDDIPLICEQFEDEFGLALPYFPMLYILNRCVRRRLLARLDHGFTVSATIAHDLSVSQKRDSYIGKERALLQGFIRYAQTTYQETIEPDTAESAMLDFLRRFDIEILISRDGTASALPERPKGHKNRTVVYMFSRFVIDAYETNPADFRTLCDMALGNMIMSAILHDGYNYRSDTVRNLNVYIDTPIILRLLGTSGKEQAATFVQLVSEMRERGAKLWIFEHTRQESLQILEGALYWVGRADFDPCLASRTALHFRQQGFSNSRIEMFILRFDDMLNAYGIEVYRDHPFVENREHQIEEPRLE